MDLFKKCEAMVNTVKSAQSLGIYPFFTPIQSTQDHRVIIDGKEFVMIGSNGYLGLAADPRMKETVIDAVKKYGSTCSGSRFLNGTLDIHVRLEEEIAEFFNKGGAIVFSTGFQTNLGIISSIAGKDDILIIDRQNHASIIDGCRLSFADLKKYPHNDMGELERILKSLPEEKGKLIIVDGVFSMEGDLANLPEIVRLKKKYNTRLLVDDAHGIGVLGQNGRGACEHFGVLDDVDIIMGTFSKAFASLGGFVVAEEAVITHVKHTARALIFSASMTPASVASAQFSLEAIRNEPERRERLWAITRRILEGFKKIGLDVGESETPVVPVIIGPDEMCFAFWKMLYANRVFANPVISPATPPGRALIRTSYMATHTDEDIDIVLDVFERCARESGLIK
ncbi:8-amino-7-oxononanoate synthase [candidate division WOR_3 bacterium SM23_42]|uniref:8-amino-7-oxononanoate synthase n=1 Tax=candidate division WOR_3 bacterium SM23_42 TaxID=1703779 RepID=A0A0S8FTC1_UNCW3|nr:MAG: 8-amino-7-oxononanoate synthase [candidate division WOR_3 bacterium SM23_42]